MENAKKCWMMQKDQLAICYPKQKYLQAGFLKNTKSILKEIMVKESFENA